MSDLAARYIFMLMSTKSEEEFEQAAITILEEIDARIKSKNLTTKDANDLVDELIQYLTENGYEKRDTISLEDQSGLEHFYESLSIDNSKSDELLAMAMQSAPKTGAPKNGRR